MRASQILRMRPTMARMAMPKDEHRAHTISQRLRQLKKIPIELIPLGAVMAVALGAAFYSMGHKLANDRTLRLWKEPKEKKKH